MGIMFPEPRCPVAETDPFSREFLAQCHAEAHHRSVKAGQPPVPCLHCGRDRSRQRVGLRTENESLRVSGSSTAHTYRRISLFNVPQEADRISRR